ncbi:MAG TPA: hypothetical protein V6C97_15885 [Oculatellaceae cyanobacterium]
MSNSLWSKKQQALTGAVTALLLAGVVGVPSHAQSYSYLPWALGSSLLYPLRYLGYSAYGNSGYNNPLWMGGSLLQRASRGYGGLGYNGYSPYGNPNFANVNNYAMIDNSNPNVVRYGGVAPQNAGGAGSAATGSTASTNTGFPGANPAYGNYSNSNYPAVGQGAPFTGVAPTVGQPYPSTQSGFPAQAYNPNGMPNRGNTGNQTFTGGANAGASSRHGKSKSHKGSNSSTAATAQEHSNSGMSAASPAVQSTSSAPFAMAFINNVNSDYNGDIRKAMANSSTRAWAQSLGISIKNSAPISDDRAGTIERILKDNGLDPVSKLNTVKILLGN